MFLFYQIFSVDVEIEISRIRREKKLYAFGNLILKHGFFCHIVRQGQQVSSKRK